MGGSRSACKLIVESSLEDKKTINSIVEALSAEIAVRFPALSMADRGMIATSVLEDCGITLDVSISSSLGDVSMSNEGY